MPTKHPIQFACLDSQSVFAPGVTAPVDPVQDAAWFLFQGDRLLVSQIEGGESDGGENGALLPVVAGENGPGLALRSRQYLGCWTTSTETQHCFSGELADDSVPPTGYTTVDLRSLFGVWDDRWMAVAGRAKLMAHWERDHQYCGRCGSAMEGVATERARRCPTCLLTSYPRISPAIIIAITRKMDGGERILLARNHRFPTGRYSIIAGFVEAGETLEECARREVMEEVGIQIGNIRYYGSQSWPFPNSLMIGFVADYAGGEIRVDKTEIAAAAWFAPDAMPLLPPKISIARQLIDSFLISADTEGAALTNP